MNSKFLVMAIFSAITLGSSCQNAQKTDQQQSVDKGEEYRPVIHFTPKKGWMNDPNGMVYLNGMYHLFFQHNPDSTVWGPMHWGHATSKDLIHWEEQPIALFPDSLGTIFSGSAVVDKDNTAGFGKNTLVAIFTHHNHELEEAKTGRHQYQSLAYSTDEGKTWVKYAGNPVLPNPGITDFRDPKVRWNDETKQWVMTLATKQTITFYGSPDLKAWTRLSEFGEGIGAHGGVWECPDLFPLTIDGQQKWVLLVSINPGGPNGGSATQYFIGDFDGKIFKPDSKETRWVDYGADDYAGITWSNTEDRAIFLGWMSNWTYANVVPASTWRSANTIPRELTLKRVGKEILLTSLPVKELNDLKAKEEKLDNIEIDQQKDLSDLLGDTVKPYTLKLSTSTTDAFAVRLANAKGEEVLIGYDKQHNQFYVDRTKAGKNDFEPNFAKRMLAPRILSDPKITLILVVDMNSVEVFADGGLSVLTNIFFPNERMDKLSIQSPGKIHLEQLEFTSIR